MSIRWRVFLTLGVIYIVFGLPVALSQVTTQETTNERHRSAIERLENDVKRIDAVAIEARLRLLEDSREENRQLIRVISTVLIGHIITAIWQKRRTR